jgi:hypothetical protein
MTEVLDAGVGAREHEAFVTVVAPLHDIGRGAVGTVHLEDLGIAIGLADMVSLDDQPVTYCCTHQLLLSPGLPGSPIRVSGADATEG